MLKYMVYNEHGKSGYDKSGTCATMLQSGPCTVMEEGDLCQVLRHLEHWHLIARDILLNKLINDCLKQ